MLSRLTVAALLLAVAGCLVGCPKRTVTIPGPEGQKATVTTSGKDQGKMTVTSPEGEKTTVEAGKSGDTTTVTVEGKKGTTTISATDKVDLAALGVEAYPGATAKSGGSYKAEGAEAGGMAGASLTTPDPFDKVAKFYKDKYSKGAKLVQDMPNMLMIHREEKGEVVMIMVQREEGKSETTISISKMSGKGMGN